MKVYTPKPSSSQPASIAGADTTAKQATQPVSFTDNRAETASQKTLQDMAEQSQQSIQLKNYQAMADQQNMPAQFNKRKRSDSSHNDKGKKEPAKKKRRINRPGQVRMHSTYLRNRDQKATPVNDRDVFEYQEDHSYGYDNKIIEYGDVKGDFYKGPFAGQPYLRIDKDDYDLKVKPKTNYDDIINGLEKYKDDAALAGIMLEKIYDGIELPEDLNPTVKANVALIIQLTQFIENHDTRVPGVDKLARSFLTKIRDGELSFREVFNRKNGMFVVARAKGGGSKYGGQEAGRALFGMTPKKTDKARLDYVWTPEIDKVAEDMSDSSEEESDD